MKLAALYLSDHAYLNNEFDMINFGGRYHYSLSAALPLTITRRPNEQFIDRFFDVSESKISLENVSAIVGQNGVGKSTLLDAIRRNFIENTYALPRASSFLLIEDGETVFYYSAEEFDLSLLKGLMSSPIERLRKSEFQTIYYSPHFDLRFNPNFDEVDYFDISLDKYIDLDLQDLEYRGTNEHGMAYPVKQELLFKNAMRQIHFMDSDLVKNGVFKKYFSFPPHGRAVMTIRETKYEKSLRNVPRAFLSALEKLQKKIEDELNNWTIVRELDDKRKVDNQLDIDRYLLKRNLLHDLLSVLIRQMDISNSYLSEAEFDQHHFDAAENNSAFDYFKAFLESCSIYTAKGPEHPFDVTLISQLIDEIYRAADSIDHSDLLKQQELKVSAVDAIKILQLQREVIADISNYYGKQVRYRPSI